MVQWIRICLSTQGTRFRSLVWEDSHALEQLKPLQPATEPMCCDSQSLGTWSHRSEKPARRRREQTLLTKTRGGPRAAMTIQRNQKKKKKNYKGLIMPSTGFYLTQKLPILWFLHKDGAFANHPKAKC